MPRKLTPKEWLLREAAAIAKDQLQKGLKRGAEHALPAIKEAGIRAQRFWSDWRRGAKKVDLLEAVNILRSELHAERLAHEKTKARLKRAMTPLNQKPAK